MKYIISLFAGLVLFSSASIVFARTITLPQGSLNCDNGVLTDSNFNTSSASNDEMAYCQGQNGPLVGSIPEPWGLTDGQTPKVEAGTRVHDDYGNVFKCPAFLSTMFIECFDLTHTDFYNRVEAPFVKGLNINEQ